MLVCPSLSTVHTDDLFIIIYFAAVPLFLAVTVVMFSEKLSLVPFFTVLYNSLIPSVAVLYKHIQL